MELELLEPVIEEGPYRWLINIGNCLVGIHWDLGWCVRLNDDVLILDAEKKFVPLGPLLQLTASEFNDFLHRASLSNPEIAQRICDFPRHLLLKHIFHTSYSSYWPERALAWVAADRRLWSTFRWELKQFSENRVMSQRARQEASKILKTLNFS